MFAAKPHTEDIKVWATQNRNPRQDQFTIYVEVDSPKLKAGNIHALQGCVRALHVVCKGLTQLVKGPRIALQRVDVNRRYTHN